MPSSFSAKPQCFIHYKLKNIDDNLYEYVGSQTKALVAKLTQNFSAAPRFLEYQVSGNQALTFFTTCFSKDMYTGQLIKSFNIPEHQAEHVYHPVKVMTLATYKQEPPSSNVFNPCAMKTDQIHNQGGNYVGNKHGQVQSQSYLRTCLH